MWSCRQVRRCDEAGGEGGVDGWLGGCPYASVGGYSWHSEYTLTYFRATELACLPACLPDLACLLWRVSVLFDPPHEARLDPRTGRLLQQTLPPDLPLLAVHREDINAKWTGPGNQVGR